MGMNEPLAAKGQRDARGKLRSLFQTVNDQPSETVQSDAHLTDIQHIMKQFGIVGMSEHLDLTDRQFMDVSEFTDYADMMNHVREAETAFMDLPSKIRERFDHDVFKWLDAAHERRAPEERSRSSRSERAGDPDPVSPDALVEPVAPKGQAAE